MPLDQTANFVRATLASAIAAGDNTIALADSGQLVDPANGEYNLVVWDPSSYPRPGQDPAVEIVRATALDSGTNELTVDRGQEGTAAADHAVEAVLQLTPTAKYFSDIDSKTSALSADGQTYTGDTIDVGSASVGDLDIGSADLLSSGDFAAVGPSASALSETLSTTQTDYELAPEFFILRTQWDSWQPDGAQTAVLAAFRVEDATADVRLHNINDSETIFEETGLTSDTSYVIGPIDYTPITTDGPIGISFQIRSTDGSETKLDAPSLDTGVQL